jgi:hypothetical protein
MVDPVHVTQSGGQIGSQCEFSPPGPGGTVKQEETERISYGGIGGVHDQVRIMYPYTIFGIFMGLFPKPFAGGLEPKSKFHCPVGILKGFLQIICPGPERAGMIVQLYIRLPPDGGEILILCARTRNAAKENQTIDGYFHGKTNGQTMIRCLLR